ncbi:MAG: cobalt-precorrin-8X methylmutase [Synechococcaceae cyanobacterium RL_1_2]|nr:cobalt-precorrin-8X methylmutase [Synechococcaceae cyanobacterium RL_1_2]
MALIHPITQQSFDLIDREIPNHHLSPEEYAIARRVIHTTADFEFLDLLRFTPTAISIARALIQAQTPIITDVTMVKQGILTVANQTFQNDIISCLELTDQAAPGLTRTETGMKMALERYPQALYAIGNAPTALLALCHHPCPPPLVIGVPVGFVAVEEAKATLAQSTIPHILTTGRKGGSPVAAAIINALLIMAKMAKLG